MKKTIAIICLLVIGFTTTAQKKPLDHSVYDSWQHIGEQLISPDGKWVVYTIDPQQGDNELVIRSTENLYTRTIPRGYNAVITYDSRFVIFKIRPLYRDTREARIKKKKPDDMPKDSIAIVELGQEGILKKARVKNFKVPQKGPGWVAYHLEKTVEKKETPAAKKQGEELKKVTDSLNRVIDSLEMVIESFPVKKKKRNKKDEAGDALAGEMTAYIQGETDFADGDEPGGSGDAGTDLVLRNLLTGEEKLIHHTLEYFFSKTGNVLLLEQARDPKDSLSQPEVQLYELPSLKRIILSRGGNEFKNFTIHEDGSQLAYLAERDARKTDLQKFYRLWYYKTGMDSAMLLADKHTEGMQLGMTVSEFGNPSFSKSGKRLFFGVAPVQPPKDTSIIEIDKPRLDIWHYKDDYLQTVQTNANRLRNSLQENFLAVYDLETGALRQLGSKDIPQVIPTNEGDGSVFIGVSDVGKRIESQWQGVTRKDIFSIDVQSGEARRVKEKLHGQVYPSSTGKYILWYDRVAKHYFTWNGKEVQNITGKIKVPVWNEEYDSPDDPNNYGIMGWHENDSVVYIYDRYDAWICDPAGKKDPLLLGTGGRRHKNVSRYIRTDPEERFISPGSYFLFRVFNETDKSSALWYYHQYFDDIFRTPPELTPSMYGSVIKAANAKRFIYTVEDFISPPDLYFSLNPGDYHSARLKLSSVNPQQSQYLWGTAELFSWKAYNGKTATGIVYKPDNFDPKKKYPVIVYFYEKLSQGLHDYKEPAPIRSAINIPYFVSNGYLLFLPDITYKTGYPGQSAYDYVVSGARALVKKGWADSTRIAVQGHSWGGYQAAQLATMTKLFKAVWAGAPVANMTSAYGGIRWESGVNRQFQYEKTQSRIGATLWEKPELYIKNSPLFHLDKVTAPMVILHNDADGAVPWYQGIELFTGLRRLGKKVWMFNYNGQGHGLTQRPDMLDYHIRMQQFFDWILRGAKPARWITEGVPAIKKGKDWGLEIVDE